MTEEDFLHNILGNAQKLCTESADRYIDTKVPSRNPNYDADADEWDKIYLGESAGKTTGSYDNLDDVPIKRGNTRIPKAIQESIFNNPINRQVLADNPLDRMDFSKHEAPKRKVNETLQPQNAAPVNNGIDYTIIKAIINECLDSKLGSMKTMLTEGTSLTTIGLKNGTIRLVDNKGNIFSAKLEKVGNVNEK